MSYHAFQQLAILHHHPVKNKKHHDVLTITSPAKQLVTQCTQVSSGFIIGFGVRLIICGCVTNIFSNKLDI